MQTQESALVTQEFRYYLPEAGEVFLVWGVNGWQVVPEEMRPAGTVVEFGVMYTPMKLEGNAFVAQVQVPAATTLDYGFQIKQKRNGPLKEWVWDGDYRLVAAKNDIIEVKATVTLPPDQTPQNVTDVPLVTQEFRYHMPEADEVFLIWGVDGWQVVPEEMRPAGTVVEFKVMHTPMELEGDSFIAQMRVPVGTTLDYGFQTRKKHSGADAEWVWDGDYRLSATEDSIVEMETTVTLAEDKKSSTGFNIGPHLLIGVSLVFGAMLLLKRILPLDSRRPVLPPAGVILSVSASLYFFLLLIRANILNFKWVSLQYSLKLVPDILAGGYYDLYYVMTITVFFLGFLLLFRKNLKAQRLICLVYSGLVLLSLLIAFVNIQVVQMLGRPFNYQWFYYSDFLTSKEAQSAILANVSSNFLLNAVTLSAAMITASRLLLHSVSLWPTYKLNRPLMIAIITPLFVYLPVANWYIKANNWDYVKLANPITSFLESVIDSYTHPVLFTMTVAEDFEEFQPIPNRPLETISMRQRTNTEIRNVILVVLESVGVKYLEVYGGAYPVTPELNSYRQHSLLFTNVYAHAPASNKSLVSILAAIYPWLSYHTLTQEYPTVNLPTLSSELKKYGYRTAFLSAGDSSFQRGDEFLAHRQFDKIANYSTLGCGRQSFQVEWAYNDGIDEECLIEVFSDWQSESPEQPFFTMMWTLSTHYPYSVVGEEVDYGVNDETFNRYLNALHHTDKVLGQLFRLLEERGLSESTLVVIVGDHGEAFGEHHQFFHTSKIYEENVHVPLIFINPSLFGGEENSTIGGHADIAPTIMHILNLPAPVGWQGRSFFDSHRSGRTYFFAPWEDLLFGYRENNLKFIFNASTNSYEVYDLVADPNETTNLADQMLAVTTQGHQHLAAWVQYQDKFMKELFSQQK